jgi:DNA-directed RNA polymerase specialized sigma24 family protein
MGRSLPAAAASTRLSLVQQARARKAEGDRGAVLDVLVLDDALTRLAALDPNQARIVELRYFGRLTVAQTAAAIGAAASDVAREWTMARAWLKRAVDSASDESAVVEGG